MINGDTLKRLVRAFVRETGARLSTDEVVEVLRSYGVIGSGTNDHLKGLIEDAGGDARGVTDLV